MPPGLPAPARERHRSGARAALQRLGLIMLIAAIAGCAAPPRKPGEAPAASIDRAEELADSGRPLAAVRIYRDLAAEAEAPDRQRWRLRLVELLFEHGYPELALEWHGELNSEPVPAKLSIRKRVTDAQAAIARRQGIRALRLLPLTDPEMPRELRARILAVRADGYRLTGQPGLALLERIDRERLLSDDEAIEDNHDEIWAVLEMVPVDRLERMTESLDEPVARGWAELAHAVRSARLARRPVTDALDRWRHRFADHPAARRFAGELRDRVVAESTYPDRIALLLPLSGRLSGAGAAIRDGLLTAYYAQPGHIQRPRIEIYDTGEEGQSAADAYDQALAEGASFVIGPLSKAAVAEVAERGNLDVPVLSLNYLPEGHDEPPEDLYQFGLLPEDEARQAAEAAIQNGHFNALALVPSGNWGERMLGAFRQRYDELGGAVLEASRYNAEATDYGTPIQQLLDLDASYARARRVQSTIGQNARFDPRRRQDVEVIFVAAMPRQARLINPQLDFHRAGKLPTYTTSHAFSGTPDPDSDWDMNGLFFTETPWILENLAEPKGLYRRIAEHWPASHERYPRLYALGVDAFTILPHLDRMDDDPANALTGRTGHLTLDGRRRIHRQLHWAQMDQGAPTPIARPGAQDPLSMEALPDEGS